MIEQIKSFLSLTPAQLEQPLVLKKKEQVYFLVMNTKANSFTHKFIRGIQDKLDEIEKSEGAVALVTVSLSKMFSGGLDLKYVSNLDYKDQRFFILEFIHLIGRISVLPFPTFAVVKGGAVAGGCMFSFAHDYIYVSQNAIFACNEVDIGLPLPPGMMSVIKKRHNSYQTLRDMTLFGKKYSAKEALEAKFIDAVFPQKEALENVYQLARKASSYGENRVNFKKLKQETFKEVIDCCFNKQHAVGVIGQTSIPMLPKL